MCVLMICGQTRDAALERVQIYILAEGLKMALSGRESSLIENFCEYLVYTLTIPFILPHDSEICDSRLSNI